MSTETLGVILILVVLAVILLGVPVYLSLWALALAGAYLVMGFAPAADLLRSVAFHVVTSYTFSVVVFFIFMGAVVDASGIAERLYDGMMKLVPRVPGLLYLVTIFANAAFGACSGSTAAAAVTFTKIALPNMIKRGYSKSLSAGCIAVSGTLATMIPPSVLMVVFCMLTDLPIGKLFLAGYIPGLLTAVVYAVLTLVLVKLKPELGPPHEAVLFSARERFMALVGMWPVVLLAALIIGGFFGGVWTSTEIGAAAAILAIFIALMLRRFGISDLIKSTLTTVHACGLIFVIIIGAMAFGRFIAVSGLSARFADWIVGLNMSPNMIVLAIMGLYFILGMFIDEIGMMSITLPILFPIMEELGVDTVWFAILVIAMMQVGLATPPVGLNVFNVKAAAGGLVTLEEIFNGTWFYIAAELVVVLMIWLFPPIATWLPGLIH